MDSSHFETTEIATDQAANAAERRRVAWSFGEWCLQQEITKRSACFQLIFPSLLAGGVVLTGLRSPWESGRAQEWLQFLFVLCAITICVYGAIHASKAICWEIASDLRDLVRLTGIDPLVLLWCRVLSRWLTIVISVVLVLPLALFVSTLGEVTRDLWMAGGCWLVLIAVLTAGFTTMAGVSPGDSAVAEQTAIVGTIVLVVLYHFVFLGMATVIVAMSWLVNGDLTQTRGIAVFVSELMPALGFFRAIDSPTQFSPLSFSYWGHFLTAILCCRMASIVMCNRFRVSRRGEDDGVASLPTKDAVRIDSVPLRPRCGDSPFFWKDAYVLSDLKRECASWTMVSLIGLASVLVAMVYEYSLVAGIIAVCVAPVILALRFEALLAAEFREQAWASLMLLPGDPRVLLVAKIQVAATAVYPIMLPVGAACLIAAVTHGVAILILVIIAFLMAILLIEISILSHVKAPSAWDDFVMTSLALVMVAWLIFVWIRWTTLSGVLITIAILLAQATCFYLFAVRRLRNWSEP